MKNRAGTQSGAPLGEPGPLPGRDPEPASREGSRVGRRHSCVPGDPGGRGPDSLGEGVVGGGWEASQFHRRSRQSGDVPPPGEPGPRHAGWGRGTGLDRPPRAGPCAGGSAPSPGPPVAPRFSPPHLLYRGAGTRTRTRGKKVGIEREGPQMTDHRLCDRPCVHPQNRPSRPSRSCCLRRWSNRREAARAHVWGRGHWSL